MHVAAFYHFVSIGSPETFVAQLKELLAEPEPAGADRDGGSRSAPSSAELRGTVLVAEEGLNATLSGDRGRLEAVISEVERHLGVRLDIKWSRAQEHPFRRLLVRARPEIVTFGKQQANPRERTAPHVDARTWAELLQRDDVLVLDVRNDYEVHAGRFRGATAPETNDFSEFARYVERELAGREQQKIAMYCTGGIRCEKASSWMLAKGFADVVQLDGGVLGYFAQRVERDRVALPGDHREPLWEGECFVFDERATVTRDLEPGGAVLCPGCGWPVTAEEQEHATFREQQLCPRCAQRGSASRE